MTSVPFVSLLCVIISKCKILILYRYKIKPWKWIPGNIKLSLGLIKKQLYSKGCCRLVSYSWVAWLVSLRPPISGAQQLWGGSAGNSLG